LSEDEVKNASMHPHLRYITSKDELSQVLSDKRYESVNILCMSSGNFEQLDLKQI